MPRPRRRPAASPAPPIAPRDPASDARLVRWFARPGSFLVRPPEHLADLPVRYRWEVTRRHPHYLVAWDAVRRHRRGEPARSAAERDGRILGEALLMSIGVDGEPVDPALEFDDRAFGGGDPFVISGACRPVTLRALAMFLLGALPPQDRRLVGTIFFDAGAHDEVPPEKDEPKRQRGMRLLNRLEREALNSYPLWPLFHVHVGSSQRTVLQDVADQVRLRQRGRAVARATRPETLDEYLAAWDAREGWTGAGYARRAARQFAEVGAAAAGRAGRRKASASTAFDRYRRAFELIVGRPYAPEIWWPLFGRLKFGELFGDPADGARVGPLPHRHRRRPPLPEPDEVLPRLRAWAAEGLPDEEIAFRLRVEPGVIAEVRAELADRESEGPPAAA